MFGIIKKKIERKIQSQKLESKLREKKAEAKIKRKKSRWGSETPNKVNNLL